MNFLKVSTLKSNITKICFNRILLNNIRTYSKLENYNNEKEKLQLEDMHPKPIRQEFYKNLSSKDLENLDINLMFHRVPHTISDKVALSVVKLLRIPTDLFFKKKYVHRAVMLETVAAVPGMVAATLRHLKSLRMMKHDGGWIYHLLHEAENERMHLMTWMRISQPTVYERILVTFCQGIFYNFFFFTYIISSQTAHRIVGYLEEEAVISYTSFLNEIDNGNIENIPAPKIAIDYWYLDKNAKLRDVVLAIRADEAFHRDSNHLFADRIMQGNEDLRNKIYENDAPTSDISPFSKDKIKYKDLQEDSNKNENNSETK